MCADVQSFDSFTPYLDVACNVICVYCRCLAVAVSFFGYALQHYWFTVSKYIQGAPKDRDHYITSSECMNEFAWFLTATVIQQPGFSIRNQVKPLHLIAHIFEATAECWEHGTEVCQQLCKLLQTAAVCIIVGTLQCHVLNMPVVFHQLFIQSGTTWWKITTRFTSLKTKACFLKPSCFLTAVQTFWKIDCTSMILSFKDMFWYVLLQNAFQTMSPFTDACKTFCHASLHYPLTSTVRCCWSRPWTASYLPVFRYTAAVEFSQQSLVLLNILCWNDCSGRRRRNAGCCCRHSPGGATFVL